MNLEQLRQKRKDLLATMDGVKVAMDAGALSDEQAASFDAAETEFCTTDANVKRLEKLGAHAERMAAPRPAVAERQIAERIARGPEASTEFESFGEFMHAVRFAPNDQRLDYHEAGLRGEQSMGVGTEGGFAVPKQFLGQLLSVEQSPSVIRPLATVIPAGSPPDAEVVMPALNQANSGNMYGGVAVTWIGEGGTKAETSAAIEQVSLVPKEVAGIIKVTDKLLRNWQAADTVLRGLLSKAIVAAEESAFISGNGAGKPLGFIGAGASKVINRTTTTTVVLADLFAMEEAIIGNGSPVWLMSQKVRSKIRALNSSSTGGSLIWGDGSVVSGTPQTLLGKPAFVVDRMPVLGAKGDLCLVDLSYYLIKDGSGPFVAASEHVYFANNKTVIKAFWNVDGQPWLTKPLTMESGDIMSPFVVLDVPAA